jgi:hypothetical protein
MTLCSLIYIVIVLVVVLVLDFLGRGRSRRFSKLSCRPTTFLQASTMRYQPRQVLEDEDDDEDENDNDRPRNIATPGIILLP